MHDKYSKTNLYLQKLALTKPRTGHTGLIKTQPALIHQNSTLGPRECGQSCKMLDTLDELNSKQCL